MNNLKRRIEKLEQAIKPGQPKQPLTFQDLIQMVDDGDFGYPDVTYEPLALALHEIQRGDYSRIANEPEEHQAAVIRCAQFAHEEALRLCQAT